MPSVLLLRRAWPSSEMILTCLRHVSYIGFFFENGAPFLKPAQIQRGRETAGREWLPLAQAVQITRRITVKK